MLSYLIIIMGTKRLRENGWKVLSLLVVLGSMVQVGAVCLVVRGLILFLGLGLG